MKAVLCSWWQKIRKPLVVIGFIAALIVIALIFLEVIFYGTGFAGKKLWDWLQLLIAPAAISLAVAWFTHIQQQRDRRLEQLQHDREQQLADQRAKSEHEATEQRAQTERDIALDNQRETVLQVYIDKMSELLLEKDLRNSQPVDEVRNIARVRTLTVLPRLDGERKKSVLQFLYESGLIEKGKCIIDLNGADFRNANLLGIDLRNADLSGANLKSAYMAFALLGGADLSETDLSETSLWGANLRSAILDRATLRDAHLGMADLRDADLGAAFLVGAEIDAKQLEIAKSLQWATMPDGVVHL